MNWSLSCLLWVGPACELPLRLEGHQEHLQLQLGVRTLSMSMIVGAHGCADAWPHAVTLRAHGLGGACGCVRFHSATKFVHFGTCVRRVCKAFVCMSNHRTHHPGCMAAPYAVRAPRPSASPKSKTLDSLFHEARLLHRLRSQEGFVEKALCRSLSSIHLLYYQALAGGLSDSFDPATRIHNLQPNLTGGTVR